MKSITCEKQEVDDGGYNELKVLMKIIVNIKNLNLPVDSDCTLTYKCSDKVIYVIIKFII